MYYKQAFDAKKRWWLYLIGIAVFFIGWQSVGMLPLGIAIGLAGPTASQLQEFSDIAKIAAFLGGNLFMLMMLLTFVLGLFSLWIFVKTAHKRKFTSLISIGKVNYRKILFSFLSTSVYHGAFLLIGYLLSPELFEWSFNPETFWYVLIMAVLVLPFQTSCEEIVFRGYLMQSIGVLLRYKWVAILLTSIGFGLLHSMNPEVEVIGWSSMIFYIGFGLFMAIITTMDDGLELAIGFHWATNFFGIAIVSSNWGTAQTDTLITDLSEPGAGASWMYISTAALVLMYLLFALVYKWKSPKKLFEKVELPDPVEREMVIEDDLELNYRP
jgi:membrane protease YdiL (CAAX protease family)